MIELQFSPGRDLRAHATLFVGARNEREIVDELVSGEDTRNGTGGSFFDRPIRATEANQPARRAVTIAAGACSSAPECLGNLEQGLRRLPFQPDRVTLVQPRCTNILGRCRRRQDRPKSYQLSGLGGTGKSQGGRRAPGPDL